MLNLDVIESEIHDLEARGDTTYSLCEKLAWLYIVRDHIRPQVEAANTQELRGSEFLELASGVSYPALMGVLDEHMDVMRTLYPKSYETLMDRIRELHRGGLR